MSRTTCLKCLDCGESLWIGQSNRIYGTEIHIMALNVFLINHEMHILKFGDDDLLINEYDIENELHYEEDKYLKERIDPNKEYPGYIEDQQKESQNN